MKKNVENARLFLEGKRCKRNNYQTSTRIESTFSVYYRLGVLHETCRNKPTKLKLVKELYREFYLYSDYLPNVVDIILVGHYSHRLLRRTFDEIGYHIPVNFSLPGFHAWRVH